jgi:hypothetical protein
MFWVFFCAPCGTSRSLRYRCAARCKAVSQRVQGTSKEAKGIVSTK